MRESNQSENWKDFCDDEVDKRRDLMRLIVLAGGLAFVFCWIWDWQLDSRGAERTIWLRLIAAAPYLMVALLMAWRAWFRRHTVALYVASTLSAPVYLVGISVLLEGGQLVLLGGGMFVLILIVGVGPIDRIAIPLAAGVVVVTSLSMLLISQIGATDGSTITFRTAVQTISFLAATAGLLAVLSRRVTDTNFELYKARRELERQSVTDPLTGALNRRGLERSYAHEIARQQRRGYSSALLMLDLDHFKHVNDSYGHQVGDEVLQDLSRRVQSAIRDIDLWARLGGEEFAVILVEADTSAAFLTAERIRKSVSAEAFTTSGGPLSITVSIGVRAIDSDTTTLEQALADADEALYRAKAEGRNRTELWGAGR